MKFQVDFNDFKRFAHKVRKLSEQEVRKRSEQFCEETVQELVNRLLAKVVARTPVGEYGTKDVHFVTKDGKEVRFTATLDKTGGTLRRGWTVGEVTKRGNEYEVELINPVQYATYVEYGHRTPPRRDGSRGWVEGRFMLTISEEELKEEAPTIIERKIKEFVEGL